MEETSAPVPAPEPEPPKAAADKQVQLEEAPQPKAPTLCGVCDKEVAKYKCARCPLAYCSVACSRAHRDSHPPSEPVSEIKKHALPPKPPTPTKKSKSHPFSVLDDSMELQQLFARYPNLPARLSAIADVTLPPKGDALVSGAMHWSLPGAGGAGNTGHGRGRGGRGNGRARGGRGGGRGGGGSTDAKNNRPWTKEAGLRKGLDALRAARTDPTEDGDGVREYSELVLHLLAREAGETVFKDTREEVAAGDAALLEELLKADGDL